VDGFAPVATQLNVYGAVPPVAEAVQDTAVPTVPVAGQLTVAESASGLIVIVAVAFATTALVSVALTDTVYVPFTE